MSLERPQEDQERRPTPGAHLGRIRRQILLEGAAHLGDAELLALCLGKGAGKGDAVRRAQVLLDEIGGLSRVARTRAGGLRRREGFGPTSAAHVAAVFELGRRALLDETRKVPHHPLDRAGVAAWAHPRLVGLGHEEVWVLCVDGRSVMTSAFQVGRGGTHGCALLTRDVLAPVLREGASGFVLVHNHPSGDPTPSREDIELTRNLESAARTVGVPLLDHVIVARGGSSSLFELGLM